MNLYLIGREFEGNGPALIRVDAVAGDAWRGAVVFSPKNNVALDTTEGRFDKHHDLVFLSTSLTVAIIQFQLSRNGLSLLTNSYEDYK